MQDKIDIWLLGNALAHHADRNNAVLDDDAAIQVAANTHGSDTDKLNVFVGQLKLAQQLRPLINDYRHWLKIARFVVFSLAFISGAAAAFTLLTPVASSVNLLSVTVVCALIPLLSLFIWLGLSIVGLTRSNKISGGVLGRFIHSLTGMLSKILLPTSTQTTRHQQAVFRAGHQLASSPGVSPWLLSLLTHTGWLLFSAGALLGALFRLSFYQYDFYWGSTLLGPEQISIFVQSSYALPAWLTGISLDSTMIAAAQLNGGAETVSRSLWASLLLVSIVIYGILPRLILIVLSKMQLQKNVAKLPDNFANPLFLDALRRIKSASWQQISDTPASYPLPASSRHQYRGGKVALIAFELDQPEQWPLFEDDDIVDLGHVKGMTDFAAAMSALATLEKPLNVIAFCSYARSPDNTTLKRLRKIQDAAQGSVFIQLCERATAQSRQIDMVTRVADWQSRAAEHDIGILPAASVDATSLGQLIANLPSGNSADQT